MSVARRLLAGSAALAAGLGLVLWLGGGARAGGASEGPTRAAPPPPSGMAEAIFASGCFWCAERDFEKAPGVVDVVSGYAGGSEPAPTYEEVSAGQTGHAEAVRVVYDPARASYAQLLQYFLHHTDVLDGGGQFCDRGKQYRPVIFPRTPAEKEAAKQALEGVRARFGRAPAVTLEEARSFWVAEGYHQDFSRKDPVRYTSYRKGCGRDARVRVLWGDTP